MRKRKHAEMAKSFKEEKHIKKRFLEVIFTGRFYVITYNALRIVDEWECVYLKCVICVLDFQTFGLAAPVRSLSLRMNFLSLVQLQCFN